MIKLIFKLMVLLAVISFVVIATPYILYVFGLPGFKKVLVIILLLVLVYKLIRHKWQNKKYGDYNLGGDNIYFQKYCSVGLLIGLIIGSILLQFNGKFNYFIALAAMAFIGAIFGLAFGWIVKRFFK